MNDAYFSAIQNACLPGVWSKAIALSRSAELLVDKRTSDEIVVRVLVRARPVHPRVNLWPEDEDWYCDCGDRADPCVHIAAVAIALKSGSLQSGESAESRPSPGVGLRIAYVLRIEHDGLVLTRHLVKRDETPSPENLLRESLVSRVGGIQSGRVQGSPVAATQDDFAVDRLLGPSPSAKGFPIPTEMASKLFSALESAPAIWLHEEGKATPVEVSAKPVTVKLRVDDSGSAFGIFLVHEKEPDRRFGNSAALFGSVLRPVRPLELSAGERRWIDARAFSHADAARFVSEILPGLERKLKVEIATTRLPRLIDAEPAISLRTGKGPAGDLTVVADLVYGDPPIARLGGEGLEFLKPGVIPVRKLAVEHALKQTLRSELHLSIGELVRFQGEEALEFAIRARDFNGGAVLSEYLPASELLPRFDAKNGDFFFSASSPQGSAKTVSFQAAYRAWRENRDYVALSDTGGWGKVPADWLERHGERLSAFLESRELARQSSQDSENSKDARTGHGYLDPELSELCTGAGIPVPETLRNLADTLKRLDKIPQAPLPEDLTAELRGYQQRGVDWLSFLRNRRIGALLADDMGLGKTLQALCVLPKGSRSLVVAPTSVIRSWEEQTRRFRPRLKVALYHGTERKLDPSVDLTITSYGVLRLDRDRIAAENWHTLILDEAQTIKNPESQIAQAAYGLRAEFKIALTGTPIENRLEDLWSQFHFLNPGLLWSLDRFRERTSRASAAGSQEWVRDRIRPFVLRRLKTDVAPELPPRTEIVLHSELSSEEQDIYSTILASTREELVSKLRAETDGASVIQALEALLRLRQACCHPGLLPGSGGMPGSGSSSKLELLLETLEESILLGHHALVFSQWTSLLDLLEPLLEKQGINFLRLDGSTRDRAAVVSAFQADSGPPVLLISLKAGGVGLNLTRADHVFIVDPWWNPAVEDQAADRAHRIGQDQPVFIYRLVAKDTVEERILALQTKKRELAKGVLAGGEGATELTREDLLGLLG